MVTNARSISSISHYFSTRQEISSHHTISAKSLYVYCCLAPWLRVFWLATVGRGYTNRKAIATLVLGDAFVCFRRQDVALHLRFFGEVLYDSRRCFCHNDSTSRFPNHQDGQPPLHFHNPNLPILPLGRHFTISALKLINDLRGP